MTAYRTRLRVRAALERLGQGEHDLSGRASALGFADHSHMTRVLRQETGSSPSQLRQLLAPATGGR
jgi:AraC-like DNA-binding protein